MPRLPFAHAVWLLPAASVLAAGCSTAGGGGRSDAPPPLQKERIEIDNGRTTVRARPQARVSENPPGAQRIPTAGWVRNRWIWRAARWGMSTA